MKTFAKNTTTTSIAQVITLLLGVALSVVVARVLGPEGKGLYSLTILLPTLIVTFTNIGIAPATTYFTAQRKYKPEQIFGNNILLSLGIGFVSIIIGFILINFFGDSILPGLPRSLALIGLMLIPLTLLAENLRDILLGLQRILRVNLVMVTRYFFQLILVATALLILGYGVQGAIIAVILGWILTNIFVFYLVQKTVKGLIFKLDFSYIKSVGKYGAQAHIGNIFGYLHYRLDILLVNFFLNPAAVGLYSISVGIAEQLWLVSRSASMVLFPRIAAEKSEEIRKEFTPVISRLVFWITATGAFVLFFLIHRIIGLLYSTDFATATLPLQILLPGIVTRSASRVLASDIAARGKPILNSWLSLLTLIVNIGLNILWIPKFGIVGAAWASTISYSLTYTGRIWLYSRISGNSIAKILVPHQKDFLLLRRLIELSLTWLKRRLVR